MLDRMDRKILDILQRDATLPVAEIGKQIGLSTTPCWRRIQKLEELGVIQRRVAILDPKKINVGVTVFVFIITRVVGDPVKFMLPLSATEEQRAATRSALGLDQPLIKQFFQFLGDVIHFDFGESTYVRGQSAISVVFDYLPRTLELVAVAMSIAVACSIPLGLMSSRKPGTIIVLANDRNKAFFDPYSVELASGPASSR